MKRLCLTILLMLGLLASCSREANGSFTTPCDSKPTVQTTTRSDSTAHELPQPIVTTEQLVTTDPVVNPKPVTTPMVTTPPPVTEPIPVFGNVDLSDVNRNDRTVIYTKQQTPLCDEDGKELKQINAGKALILLKQSEDYAVILYQDTLYLTYPNLLTTEVPEEARALQEELGGIYYPGGEILVAIDAGHQGKAMKDKEPLGPGSDEMKTMVSSGTQGVSTQIAERELNLQVSILLRDELISRGYSVLMIRESHDVTISNVQRAQVANAYHADAFIRVHANGSTRQSDRGSITICQTPENPYNGDLFAESRRLSDCVLADYCKATGIKKRGVWETDTMTGINWAEVPVTIVEMGYMTNPEEDELMATDDFRRSAAIGMANGLDAFFAAE